MMRMRKKTMKITHWYASDMSQNDMHIAEENLMPRKRYLRNILIAALMAVLLASCASVEEAVPESPVLADTDERAVDGLFDISGLDVTSYRIRGEGPDGAWFDWVESDTPKIALADVSSYDGFYDMQMPGDFVAAGSVNAPGVKVIVFTAEGAEHRLLFEPDDYLHALLMSKLRTEQRGVLPSEAQ